MCLFLNCLGILSHMSMPNSFLSITFMKFHHIILQGSVQLSSVQSLNHVQQVAAHGLQHTRPPCPSPTPRVYYKSRLLSQYCHPAISCSVVPFSSCLQSFPASESFQMSQFFASGGQRKYWSFSFNISPSNEHPDLP